MTTNKKLSLNNKFNRFTMECSKAAGSPGAFIFAIALVAGWASFGPAYHWSSEHSLFINSCTTIITFLMVFVIQSAQNRDAKIVRIELQSILRAIDQAPNTLLGLDQDEDERLEELENELRQARREAEGEL